MRKKIAILITGSLLLLGGVFLFASNKYQIWMQSAAIPKDNFSHITCKSSSISSDTGINFDIYLTSSKKTFVNKKNGRGVITQVDISDEVNTRFFKSQKIALGQTDPRIQKYTITYSDTDIYLDTSIYINNQKIQCPRIVLEKMDIPSATNTGGDNPDTEDCSSIYAELPPSEQAGIKCTGQKSFEVTQKAPIIRVLSSFLQSNSLQSNAITYVPDTTEEDTKCGNGLDKQKYPSCECPMDRPIIKTKNGVTECYKQSIFKRIKGGLSVGGFEVHKDRGDGKSEGGFGLSGKWTF